jgi:mono/diheme cytochrome c family protein
MRVLARGAAAGVAAAIVATVVLVVTFYSRTLAQPAAASRGKQIYDAHCVECHGTNGKGDGPAAHLMTPHPRDFTSAKYKIRSTETGSLPTDDDLLRSVRQGLYGTAMPGWQKILPEDDVRAVVDYVKTLSPRFAAEKPQPLPVSASVPSTPDGVQRGAAAYEKLQCGKCHGSDGRGTNAAATTFEDDWRQPLRAADLTAPWTFHGGSTSVEVFTRFRAGMSGTPMPSFKDAATDTEMWDLANFVVSLARKPVWEMNAEETVAFYARQDAEAKANPVKRGEHSWTHSPAVCHSPVDQEKRLIPA